MKKVLLVATIEDFFNFEKQDIRLLQEMGYEVHLATNSQNVERPIEILDIVKHPICFARSPYSKKNWIAYKELNELMKNVQFDLIHCHTPVGGVVGRIIGHKYKIKTIYTAHGFHFFRGAPIKNWLLFYPIEKFLSKWTDVLVTINKEDYMIAKKFNARKVEYLPGVGINSKEFEGHVDKEKKANLKQKYKLSEEDIVLLSVGELCYRKNHQVVIKAIAELNMPNIRYIICGQGDKEEELKQEACELNVEEQILFMGYQKNIREFLDIADIYVFPSLQEGLSVALMEAMASGLPIIASKIRGNVDLIEDGRNGYLVSVNNPKQYCEKIDYLIRHSEKCVEMGNENLEIIQKFDCGVVEERMKQIYFDAR